MKGWNGGWGLGLLFEGVFFEVLHEVFSGIALDEHFFAVAHFDIDGALIVAGFGADHFIDVDVGLPEIAESLFGLSLDEHTILPWTWMYPKELQRRILYTVSSEALCGQ